VRGIHVSVEISRLGITFVLKAVVEAVVHVVLVPVNMITLKSKQ